MDVYQGSVPCPFDGGGALLLSLAVCEEETDKSLVDPSPENGVHGEQAVVTGSSFGGPLRNVPRCGILRYY